MTRLLKVIALGGASSVYLMQLPCSIANHGFSVIPNGIIPNPFAGLVGLLT